MPDQLQSAAQHYADRHACDGLEPQVRPQDVAEDQAEGHRSDVEKSGGQCGNGEPVARVQHAHGLRGQRHQQQEGEHDARQLHRQLEFSGHLVETGSEQIHPGGREDDAEQTEQADDDDEGGGHQVREQRGFLAAFVLQRLGEDGDEGGGERAFGEEVARQIGNAEAQQKRVVDEARAEQARHDDFAQQSGDARHGHRHRDHPGRPDHALGRRRIVNLCRQMKPRSLTVAARSVAARLHRIVRKNARSS